ncbi:hypothetical protein NNJEOMEG_03646 [Fundidesulfovibrio magnetotacticus]|uniref:Type IV / VI secretion system DotU domain-containing protein n=1 Tax=Fundidesulfovibrio magnetotacticus TaxID=2730080 RepID=A0A6V8LZY9_9BACT|nr:DotU family type IV/VI secretion system protein [Fundidesulfovibrio magnetotacticus]GFK95778.1 hypothetical protein NNJEOMEG_03646 [Fundidesulfovibrio magnetotacticus]
MRLVDCFIESVTLVLDVARKPQAFPKYEDTRDKVETLINGAGRMAKKLGVSAAEFQEARFAVCAWMDEMILGSAWEGKAQWLHQPLQRVVYDTVNAGEEFFERLDALLAKAGSDFTFSEPGAKATVEELSFGDDPDPAPVCAEDAPAASAAPFAPQDDPGDVGVGLKGVLEVYGLTMMLGFTGRYFHPDDQAALGSLRQKTIALALGQTPRPRREQAARLFPALYGPDPSRKERKRFWRGMDWVDVVVLGVPPLTLAVMYFAYSRILSGALKGFLGGP